MGNAYVNAPVGITASVLAHWAENAKHASLIATVALMQTHARSVQTPLTCLMVSALLHAQEDSLALAQNNSADTARHANTIAASAPMY